MIAHLHLPLPWDGYLRIIREGVSFFLVVIWFWWWLRKNKGKPRPWTVLLSWGDWSDFAGDSVYILVAGYADQVVYALAGILTARLSPIEAAGNHVISRVTLYPFIVNRALGAVINTLGSRYLGERDDSGKNTDNYIAPMHISRQSRLLRQAVGAFLPGLCVNRLPEARSGVCGHLLPAGRLLRWRAHDLVADDLRVLLRRAGRAECAGPGDGAACDIHRCCTGQQCRRRNGSPPAPHSR